MRLFRNHFGWPPSGQVAAVSKVVRRSIVILLLIALLIRYCRSPGFATAPDSSPRAGGKVKRIRGRRTPTV